MKILITEPEYFPEDSIKILKEIGTVKNKRFSREELLQEIVDVDILLVRIETEVDKEIIKKGKKLKIIATPTTGTDHIDVEFAKKRGIKVFCTPGINTIATAEFTFSLILSLLRKTPFAFDSIRKYEWERSKFFGRELEGKTLGIIGFGRIGSKVGKYAKIFGMRVITFDPYIDEKLAKEIGVEIVSFEYLLENSDIITTHAFLSKETENMISKKEFRKMKRKPFLINTARAKIVNEKNLLQALENNLISGAAIDVLEEEPLSSNNPLVNYAIKHDNLIITPHIGGSTEEAIRNSAVFIAEKIKEESSKYGD